MKIKIRFTIARKLALGFGVLMIAVLTTSFLTYRTLDANMKNLDVITNVYSPSATHLNDLYFLISNSKMLIKNWIYIDKKDDTPDKGRLKEIHTKKFPEIQEFLAPLVEKWNKKDQETYGEIILSIDTLFGFHQEIMSQLNNFDSYENIMVLFVIYPRVEENGEVILLTDRILTRLDQLLQKQKTIVEKSNKKMELSFTRFQNLIYLMALILAISVIIIAGLITRALVIPINNIKEIILSMGKGILPKEIIKTRSDEIGEMSDALNILVDGLKKTSEFALEIGKGNYVSKFIPLSKNDVLGNSLVIMRENLKNAAVEEEKRKEENTQRNWAAQGIAKFSEILRQNNDSLEDLAYEIISNLVKYLNAHIGGFFVINDENKDDIYIELIASYAFNRRKFLKKRIEIGVNLIGQCVQEAETVYMTDIPDGYIKVGSGLGEDNPKSLLIVPLILNNQVFGVIEIASFSAIQKYQIEFVERIGETVASSISTVKVNIKTAKLLSESQEKSERLAQQEEQMRQTIDQMQSGQEEMLRVNRSEKIKIQGNLNAINNSIGTVEFKMNGEFLTANDKYLKIAGIKLDDLRSKHHSEFMSKENVNTLEYQSFWSDLNNGLIHSGDHQYYFNGKEKWFYETFTPVRDENGYFYKVIALVNDVSLVKEKEEKLKARIDNANEEIMKLRNQLGS